MAENFATDSSFAGFFVSHDALGSGENRNPQAAENLRDGFLAGIKSSAGFGNVGDSLEDVRILFAVLQEYFQIVFILLFVISNSIKSSTIKEF